MALIREKGRLKGLGKTVIHWLGVLLALMLALAAVVPASEGK